MPSDAAYCVFNNPRRISMTKRLNVIGKKACVPVIVSLLSLSAPAIAEERACTGTIGPITLDNIVVPDGANCVLKGTTAKGNIVVGTGATLSATRISVNGNVQAEGAISVAIVGRSSIGGSVQIVQGEAATLDRTRINGDVLLDSNRGALSVTYNSMGGNLQVFQNTGGAGISYNVMNGNLQCKENNPAPTGVGNRAPSKEDQCANL
jgi:hypothetical protein